MPINFPDSPSVNDTHTVGDKTWTWDGTSWNVVTAASGDHGNLGGLSDDDHTQYLRVDGTRSADSLTISDNFTVDTDTLHVDSTNNRVGIGTTVPAQALDVVGNISVSGTVDGRDVASDGTKLDGIESGATADQTASEILTAIKTVDGAGSGLDADTLDGSDASAFAVSSHTHSYVPTSGGTMTGELQVNARLDVGNGSGGDHEIRIYKADNNVSDHIQFYNGTTRIGEIGCEDTTWLRINQETAKNIYTPRYIRADAGFFVDGATYGINGSGGGYLNGATVVGTLNATSSVQVNGNPVGMVLVKSQTIGSSVSSVTVNSAFSSTFRDYLIIISQTRGSGAELTFNYNGITNLYYGTMRYIVYTGSEGTYTRSAGGNMSIGFVTTNAENSFSITVNAPQVTGRTTAHGTFVGGDANGYFGAFNANNSSVTGFRLVPSSGTLTGGEIRVYGYAK